MSTEDYLHGYSASEQQRLRDQARILEVGVLSRVSFPKGARVLEVGCGVGAQTELLLRRFPDIRIVAVDREEKQLAQARANIASVPGGPERVEFRQGDAKALPFDAASFDGAFICWMLEHVPGPGEVLIEASRCLKPGAPLFANEVFNVLHAVLPKSPGYERYWGAFNSLQREMGGDPDIGLKLGSLLVRAGFKDIETEVHAEHCDRRDLARMKEIAHYWKELLLSALPGLSARRGITQADAEAMTAAVDAAVASEDGELFFGWIKGRARRA